MQVTDINGQIVIFDNLQLKINEVGKIRNFYRDDPQADRKLLLYWEDLHSKLLQLRRDQRQNKPKSKAMSILAEKTDKEVIVILSDMVRMYKYLHLLHMSKQDDEDATKARNLLQGIIESNGYRINYDGNLRRKITKEK